MVLIILNQIQLLPDATFVALQPAMFPCFSQLTCHVTDLRVRQAVREWLGRVGRVYDIILWGGRCLVSWLHSFPAWDLLTGILRVSFAFSFCMLAVFCALCTLCEHIYRNALQKMFTLFTYHTVLTTPVCITLIFIQIFIERHSALIFISSD